MLLLPTAVGLSGAYLVGRNAKAGQKGLLAAAILSILDGYLAAFTIVGLLFFVAAAVFAAAVATSPNR